MARTGPLLLKGGDHDPFCGLREVVDPWSAGSVGSIVIRRPGGGVFAEEIERRDEEREESLVNTSVLLF